MRISTFLTLALLAAPAEAAILVVPRTGDDAAIVDAGVRAGLVGVDVTDPSLSVATVADAKAAGFECAVDDGKCWYRIAELGGFSGVVVAGTSQVTIIEASGSTPARVIGNDAAAWTAAVRRARRLEGALVVAAAPADAGVVVDGTIVRAGVAVAVAPGVHKLEVGKVGFVGVTRDVDVAAGAVVDIDVSLEAVARERSLLVPVGVGVGAAALGAAVFGAGQVFADCDFAACRRPENVPLANGLAIAGGAIAVAGVGAGAALYLLE